MSKADTLGKSAAFGAASQARPSRRDLIRGIGGQDTAASINDVPVTLISENPDNPRNHLRNLDEMVESIREVGVILPIVIGTADAYLRDRADRADDLDDGTQYVVIDGHRRLEAARRVGLATIPVRVDNARLATDEAILEAAFVANYHRDDMTDLEEAHALKQLVDYYGSQSKASKRLGISQSNISSKLSLLKLAPDLQKDLMTGERRVEHVRNLGKLSPEEQRSKADQRAEASRRKTEENPENVVERVAGPADYHGVIIPEAAAKPAPGQRRASLHDRHPHRQSGCLKSFPNRGPRPPRRVRPARSSTTSLAHSACSWTPGWKRTTSSSCCTSSRRKPAPGTRSVSAPSSSRSPRLPPTTPADLASRSSVIRQGSGAPLFCALVERWSVRVACLGFDSPVRVTSPPEPLPRANLPPWLEAVGPAGWPAARPRTDPGAPRRGGLSRPVSQPSRCPPRPRRTDREQALPREEFRN